MGKLFGEIEFSNIEDGSSCAESPSKENCHYQNFLLKLQEKIEENPDRIPAGINITIYANEKENPDLLLALVGNKSDLDEQRAVNYA